MLYGYNGKMLFVDLTSGKIEEKELTKELTENFIGGYGIGAKVLYDMMPAGTDPLGPESIMGFVPGLTNGTKAFFGGRYMVVHKSPITGGWNDANSGGYFGPELKKAGFDAVFVVGISEKPVYLWINDGKAEIKDASHLWGMNTKKTWEALKSELGDSKLRVVAIGLAGEHVSLIACPINDGHRAPARGGTGAVMGSKKLKAIAVRGTGEIPVANPEKIVEVNLQVPSILKDNPGAQAYTVYGTGVATVGSALSGDSPVKNWSGVGVVDYGEENAQKVSPFTLDRYKTKKYNCSNCPLGCGAEYEVNDCRWPIGKTDRPEYETASAFGSNMLCNEGDVVIKCNEICNTYGLDTISAGMTIAWAMECYNEGILSKDELDGIDLTWGNGDAIVAIMQKMADGEGCGKILANGSAFAAKYFGKGKEYLQTASGIELPCHDPRFAPGLARMYQYDPTPGRHVKGGIGQLHLYNAQPGDKYDYNGTGQLDAGVAAAIEIVNAAGFCMLDSMGFPPNAHNDYIEAITGMKFNDEISYITGLRILTLRQAFNVREGIKPSDMTLSQRAIGKPPLTAGPLKGIIVDDDLLARNFFETVGWDMETGKPYLETLQKLGHLEEVIEDLYGEVK
ncbi:MAG TPA: aldehyde ferredoxin oxidoreductase family protein [Anaerovoracaceae bacterium]|nr:aldehyde ferredoxin oxidoreductase family protein [Anaerovoracaceae bacterium]